MVILYRNLVSNGSSVAEGDILQRNPLIPGLQTREALGKLIPTANKKYQYGDSDHYACSFFITSTTLTPELPYGSAFRMYTLRAL